jgi:hypothetical protein
MNMLFRVFSVMVAAMPLQAQVNAPQGIQYYLSSPEVSVDADYYVDEPSGIVLTKRKMDRLNGYSVDIRAWHDAIGEQPWQGEFFCEPDSLVVTHAASGRSADWYLNNLVWIDDASHNKDRVQLRAAHYPSFGHSGAVNGLAFEDRPGLPLALEEIIELRSGQNTVVSSFTMHNASDEPQEAFFIYQDAAYLWFPRGNQETILPLTIRLDIQGRTRVTVKRHKAAALKDGESMFAGHVDLRHGIVAGVVGRGPDVRVGAISGYVGVGSAPTRNGDAAHVADAAGLKFQDLPDGRYDAAYHDTDLKNRFVALDFGTLHPDQWRTRAYGRIMFQKIGGFRNVEEVVALIVSEMLNGYDKRIPDSKLYH